MDASIADDALPGGFSPINAAGPPLVGTPDYWAMRYPVTAERTELGPRVMFWISVQNRERGCGAAVEARGPQVEAV